MSLVIAYVLALFLAQVGFVAGGFVGGFLASLVLKPLSADVRANAAGFVGGLSGVALAYIVCYGIFWALVGPNSFGTGAVLTSTIPLLLRVNIEIRRARDVQAARKDLLDTVRISRDDETVRRIKAATAFGHRGMVVGEIVGIALAMAWLLARN